MLDIDLAVAGVLQVEVKAALLVVPELVAGADAIGLRALVIKGEVRS
jgi:hypothetical protein